jgi:hypothetical protein
MGYTTIIHMNIKKMVQVIGNEFAEAMAPWEGKPARNGDRPTTFCKLAYNKNKFGKIVPVTDGMNSSRPGRREGRPPYCLGKNPGTR